MGKSGIKIALKITAWIVGLLLALDLLLVGLLFVPSIQTFVVHKVTDMLNQKFNMGITIESVHITPTLRLVANEVAIKDHHHENMIYSRVVKGRLRKIKTNPITLGLGDVVFDDFDMVLRTYMGEDTINISKWADAFANDQSDNIFIMTSNTVDVNHGRFVLINDNERVVFDTAGHPGIDYAFLELADINIKAKDFLLVNDDIAMKINKLSFDQYGGFHLNDLSADFRISDTTLTLNNMRLKTDQSDLDMDLCFLYDYWTTYAEFLDSVYITSTIRPSTLSMADVAGWAPNIRGMNEVFRIEADSVKGVVNDFILQNIKTGWNGRSLVQGDIAIQDVTDFINATFDVDLNSSYVYLADLSSFTLPKGKTIPAIPILNRMEYAALDGTFKGTLEDFDTHLWFNTALGTVTTNITTNSADGQLAIKGDVSTPDLRIAKLLNMSSGLLSTCAMNASFEGKTASTGYNAENMKTLRAHLNSSIQRFSLMGYPLRDIHVEGDYKEGLCNASLQANDPNFQLEAVAQLDNTKADPFLQGSINQLRMNGGEIGRMLPHVDSNNAQGIDKLIVILQRNPSLMLQLEQFQIATKGTNLDNVNGFLACDKLKINYREDSLVNDRLRLTAINHDLFHKYILSSNIANATVESNYPILSVVDSLQNMAHNLFPSLVPASSRTYTHRVINTEDNPAAYIKFNLSTYHTRTLTKLLTPDMYIAANSTISLDINSEHESDKVDVNLPLFVLRNKFRLHNFRLNGSTADAKTLALQLSGDSVLVHVGQGRLRFDHVDLNASSSNDVVYYDLSWYNPFNSEGNISNLKGLANLSQAEDIVIQLKPSRIFLKDYECHFNDMNAIHIMPHHYMIDNLTFSTLNSSVTLNGNYDTRDTSKLSMAAKNLDISLINPLLSGISFGGSLSADLNLMNRKGTRLIYGKAITDELVVNKARLGDLFLIAGINNDNNIRFSGGLFNSDRSHFDYEYLLNYSIRDFQAEDHKIADVRGSFANKIFDVKMDFDTLQAGFIEPFLSGFSDHLSGTASGNLRFHAAPDSSYLDGKVHVLNAEMGITALGSRFYVENQDIVFNKEGMSFQNMEFMDKDRNKGYLSGDIRHDLFKNMQLDLQIHTDRLMVLDAKRTSNALFYGTGYVQGDVHMFGTDKELSFIGPELKTLKGSKIVLQVSSTNSASETNLIHFHARTNDDNSMDDVSEASSTALNFDFTFDVTDEADIVLLLESINGTMNARANGRFRLTYNENDNLNLYGNLLLHSGDFKLSLYNVVNPKFTMVPGGSISFDGPLQNMTTDLSAYKTSKTSLENIVPVEYLSGSTEVKAIINLQGQLMRKIDPTFSFELPNASNDVRNIFYTSIDTQNRENMTKQFAYFMVTNSFMPEDMFSGSPTGLSGFGLLSNMVNNVLSNVIDSHKASFGITYNQASEYSSAEYGLKANANFLNERMTMSTSIGYYDDRTAQAAYNNIYGDISVEYSINQSGTWRVKAYTYIGNRDNTYYLYENAYNYTAGVALAYKQDFDRIVTRKKNKDKKSSKRNKQENINGEQ